jgi:hypothetical protein
MVRVARHVSLEEIAIMIAGRRLLVVEGLHVGAELFLAAGTYTIGADLLCDMVLLDAGVEKQHLRLRVDSAGVGAERLGDAAVTLHGRTLAQTGFSVLDGDIVRIGAAAFSVTGVDHDVKPSAPESDSADVAAVSNADADLPGIKRHRRFVLPLSIFLTLVGMGIFFGTRALELSRQSRPAQNLAKASLHLAAVAPAEPPGNEKNGEYVARVREFMADDALDVRFDKTGRVVVSGRTSKAYLKEQLQRIRKEFEGTVEIVDAVSYVVDKGKPEKILIPQRIVDVSLSEPRWFLTADGTRNFEGAQLADGAEVVRIGTEGIVFRRNGKLTVFQFNDRE